MDKDLLRQYRFFLKDSIRKRVDFSQTDQNKGIDPPSIEKPYPNDSLRIDLVRPGDWEKIPRMDLASAIRNRQSRRMYKKKPLTQEEVSFLLWATQGVRGGLTGDMPIAPFLLQVVVTPLKHIWPYSRWKGSM